MVTKKLLNGRRLKNNGDGNTMRGAGARDGDEGGRGAEMMGNGFGVRYKKRFDFGISRITITILIILLLNSSIALAYCVASDGAECHEKLTDKAFDLIVLTDNNIDFKGSSYDSAYKNAMRRGSSNEDGAWPHTRVFNHWLNPLNGAGMLFYNNAAEWSVSPGNEYNWQKAINNYDYPDETKMNAYEYLGHTVHLVQDMSVPAHTHIDLHGPGTIEDYEDFVKQNTYLIDRMPNFNVLSIKNLNDRESFFYKLANLSYYMTFGHKSFL